MSVTARMDKVVDKFVARCRWFHEPLNEGRAIMFAMQLSDRELNFFELHTEADIEHSDTGWRAVEKFAKKLHMEAPAVEACERNLYVWEHYLNGIAAAGDAFGHRK